VSVVYKWYYGFRLVLDWERGERISDRYGLVELFQKPDSLVKPNRVEEHLHGSIAIVREPRESPPSGIFFTELNRALHGSESKLGWESAEYPLKMTQLGSNLTIIGRRFG